MHKIVSAVLGISLVGTGCADHRVWNDDVRELTMVHGGGGPPPPFTRTSECPGEKVEYHLSVEQRQLDSSWCLATGDWQQPPQPLEHKTASHTLSQAEFDALVPTLEALRVTDAGGCGADKPQVITTVTSRDGDAIEYRDSFYATCTSDDGSPDDDRPALDTHALDDVLGAFGALLRSPR